MYPVGDRIQLREKQALHQLSRTLSPIFCPQRLQSTATLSLAALAAPGFLLSVSDCSSLSHVCLHFLVGCVFVCKCALPLNHC